MSQQSKKLENIESIWKPTQKQLEFLRAGSIFEVAYLGGAGSGKSSKSSFKMSPLNNENHTQVPSKSFKNQ